MNIKKLNEELKHILNETTSDSFLLTDLEYEITFKNSDKSFKKIIPNVNTLDYKLMDLGTEQIANIVLNATEEEGLILGSNDSVNIDYDPSTGSIKSKEPLVLIDYNDEQKATLTFEVTLWIHPEYIERI